MAIEIKVPSLGEGIEGGDVQNIYVAIGDTIAVEQPLLELETGKATVDVPASEAGTITEIRVAEGDKLVVGDVIMVIQSANGAKEVPAAAPAETAPTAAPSPAAPAEETPAPVASAPSEMDIVIPHLGEGIEGGTVQSIYVAAGDEVEAEQGILELETGKATIDLPSPASGKIVAITAKAGDQLVVGDVIGKILGQGAVTAAPAPVAAATASAATAPEKTSAPAPAPKAASPKRPDGAPIPAAPSVRKFAREIGVDIAAVAGSGPKGRISLDDVKAWSKQRHESKDSGEGGEGGFGFSLPKLPDFATYGAIRTEPMNVIRRMTVEHMRNAWVTVPHVTQHDHADITDLEALRKGFQPKAEAAGTKLTVTAMLIKILGSALKVFPNFNASLDVENETVVYKDYFHVGCAVDTPNGLVVPVIRDINQKNMIEVASDLGQMAEKMRGGKIAPKDISGGCITISNLGGLGGKHFTPIVNIPEVAILGVGRATMQPVWQDDAFVPRLMMPLSLSYDHRLIDGADGTRFLRWVIDAIEQPLLISLEG
jgi:pyruvate dehydrogenase E2 component (dihydrolipoamide acetyltransferase)